MPELIRTARAMLRLGQATVAEGAGISVVTLRRLEEQHGLSKVAPATVDQVHRALAKAGAESFRTNRILIASHPR